MSENAYKQEGVDVEAGYESVRPVSYTHLDVYKRQVQSSVLASADEAVSQPAFLPMISTIVIESVV